MQPQTRLRKFVREPDKLPPREITARSLEIIALIERYKFLPTSLVTRLVDGWHNNTARHLQALYHKGLVNRFCFPRIGSGGEFIYYLDSRAAVELLIEHGLASRPDVDFDTVERNREKDYCCVQHDPTAAGKLLFLQHEVMISRFHAMLERACRASAGEVELAAWHQGAVLWNTIEVPKLAYSRDGTYRAVEGTELLPHRPDALFSLRFPRRPDGQNLAHFLYEADRGSENTTRFRMKLRAHFHFIVKRRLHEQAYGIKRIRAVLVETTDPNWAETLRECARHPIVSGYTPSELFWFTTSALFTKLVTVQHSAKARDIPRHLVEPQWVLNSVWLCPVHDTPLTVMQT